MSETQRDSSPLPSGSKQRQSFEADDEPLIGIKTEEEAIAQLQLPRELENKAAKENEAPENAKNDDERIPKISFQCSACDMREMVHYYGTTPPFVYGLKLLEDAFVMRDPFQPPPPRWKPKAEYFTVMGAKCAQCERIVCRDLECSFYYTRTYCLHCAQQQVNCFPLEVQAKLRRQLAAK